MVNHCITSRGAVGEASWARQWQAGCLFVCAFEVMTFLSFLTKGSTVFKVSSLEAFFKQANVLLYG